MDAIFLARLAAVWVTLVTGAPLPESLHGWHVIAPQVIVLDRRAMRCRLAQCRAGIVTVRADQQIPGIATIPGGVEVAVLNAVGHLRCTLRADLDAGGTVVFRGCETIRR